MWCLQYELARFPAYTILLIPVFYCANQPNPKMVSSGLVPLLTDTTVYATYNNSRNEQDVEKQDSMVANCALIWQKWLWDTVLASVFSCFLSICLSSHCSCADRSGVLWANVVGDLCWRADFNLIILTWDYFTWDILLIIVWAQLGQSFPDVYFSGCSSYVHLPEGDRAACHGPTSSVLLVQLCCVSVWLLELGNWSRLKITCV